MGSEEAPYEAALLTTGMISSFLSKRGVRVQKGRTERRDIDKRPRFGNPPTARLLMIHGLNLALSKPRRVKNMDHGATWEQPWRCIRTL